VCDLVTGVLSLKQLVEPGDDVTVDVIGPKARCRTVLSGGGKQHGAGVEVFEVLHYDGGFVGRPCWTVAEGGDETAGVHVEKGLGLFVGVDFDVLVGDLLVLEGDPDALDEGALGWLEMTSLW